MKRSHAFTQVELPITCNALAPRFNDITAFAANQIMNSHVSTDLQPSSARKIFFCPSNPNLGASFYWGDGAAFPVNTGAMSMGYTYMARRSLTDDLALPIPKPGFPYGINAASNIAATARRVPPLQFFERMHSQTLPGRCDLALDAIMSNVRSSDPTATSPTMPYIKWPPNSNFN